MYQLFAVTRNDRTLKTFPTLERALTFLAGIIPVGGYTEYVTAGKYNARFYGNGLSLILVEY